MSEVGVGEYTELDGREGADSPVFFLPGCCTGGVSTSATGDTTLLAFRRPVAGGDCWVEIERGGGPLGPREACTPAICENRVAGPEPLKGAAVVEGDG